MATTRLQTNTLYGNNPYASISHNRTEGSPDEFSFKVEQVSLDDSFELANQSSEVTIPVSSELDSTCDNVFTPDSCQLCGVNGLSSNISRYLHFHLKHSQYPCVYCQRTFDEVTDLADHLQGSHDVVCQNADGSVLLPRNTDEMQSIFVCTECSAVVTFFDLSNHSKDCDAPPLFTVPDIENVMISPVSEIELLTNYLEREELEIQQLVFSIQAQIRSIDKMCDQLRVKIGEMQTEIMQKSSKQLGIKPLIDKLVEIEKKMVLALGHGQYGCESDFKCQYNQQLKVVSSQLKEAQETYVTLGDEFEEACKDVDCHSSQMLLLIEEKKVKSLHLLEVKEKLVKIQMCRKIRELEDEKAKIIGKP